MDCNKPVSLDLHINFTDQGQVPELEVFAFSSQGDLLQTSTVEKNKAKLALPVELAGRKIKLGFGPKTQEGQARPSLASFTRNGGVVRSHRLDPRQKRVEFDFPTRIFPRWCQCLVKGKLIKRIKMPDGTWAEQPICHARVHICEVDKLRLLIPRLPDPDILRLRDDLIHRLPNPPQPIPLPPKPGPGPDPVPWFENSQSNKSFQANNAIQFDKNTQPAINHVESFQLLQSAESIPTIKNLLLNLAELIRIYICDLNFLWKYYRKDCLTTIEVDNEGQFSTLIGWDCKDQPDIYIWVEQFREGSWETVYRPSIGCGTHWNYQCGKEIIINIPDADGCSDPTVNIPPGVTQFVMPWAIGYSPIFGNPNDSTVAPTGWVKSEGLIDYDTSALGLLYDSPFANTLDFIQDDSWFIPNDGVMFYRYSYRKMGESTWTAIATPISRPYRTEYTDRLPTYDSYHVGPKSAGGETGLFEFKPNDPPAAPGEPSTVSVREWLRGNIDEPAARWNTTGAAPRLSATNVVDRAGVFEIKIEVFDKDGNRVSPSSSTFQFLARDTDHVNSRYASAAEIVDDSFRFKVHVDNNGVFAQVPQPSIDGTAASDNCGFLRYAQHDQVHIQFEATHPNDRAVFRMNVKRGSNWLPIATTLSPYVETGASVALTNGSSYTKSSAIFQHDFAANLLVGSCVNAAFAADLWVYGKATNGYHRQRIDDRDFIAFALAKNDD